MPHLVAFEIESDQLLVTVAQVAPRRSNVTHAFEIKRDANDSDQEIGERLRRWLSSHGVNRADGVAVVSRKVAEIRELVLPPAPDNELPDLVKFKARSDFGSLNDNWSLDFIPYTHDEEKPRHVLAAAISPELTSQITEIAEAAGIKLKHILFRPFAAIDLLENRIDDNHCRVIIDEVGDQFDVNVTRGNELIATRTVRISTDTNSLERVSQLLRETKRTVASVASRMDAQPIHEVLICSIDESSSDLLKTTFAKDLDVKTIQVDPFEVAETNKNIKLPENSQGFTALLGAVQKRTSAQYQSIDFLNPRKPETKSYDLAKYYRIAGILAAGFLAITFFGWWMLSSKSTEIEELTQKLNAQSKVNKDADVEQVLAEANKLDKYKQTTRNWLDELYTISSKARTPDDLIVDSVDANLKESTSHIKIKGRVVNSETETAIRYDLLETYEVDPDSAGQTGEEDYLEKFSYTVRLKTPTLGISNVETNRQAREFRNALREQEEASPATNSEPKIDTE